jgi:hypothetical protein
MTQTSPPTSDTPQRVTRWQFSLRGLLLAVTWCAVAVALRPVPEPKVWMAGAPPTSKAFDVLDAFYFAIAAALLVEGLLMWQALRAYRRTEHERFAIAAAYIGMAPAALAWGAAVITGEPDAAFGLLLLTTPVVLIVAGSFFVFWGWRTNPALLAVRMFSIVFHVVWSCLFILWITVIIWPRL